MWIHRPPAVSDHALSQHFFGRSLLLVDFPVRKELRGIGMSDWEGFAVLLAQCLNYTNTYYHQSPKLDILDIPDDLIGTLDFFITSDVLEHVLPPVGRSFVNIRQLLKPGGVLILSVPWVPEGDTKEHFPGMFKYEVETSASGARVLHNLTREGERQEYNHLVFHGGAGDTLEMRVFSKQGLMHELERAGFVNISIQGADFLPYGIHWREAWSLPLTAGVTP